MYNTWPEIDGAFIPSAARLWFEEPWWRNLFDNTLTVQFEHRMTAYALLILAVLHAIDAMRSRAGAAVIGGAWSLVAAIMLQAALGILTLLHQVPIDLALAHQAYSDRGADACGVADRTPGCTPRRARPAETGSAARAARLKLSNSNLPAFREVPDLQGFLARTLRFDAFVWGRTALLGWFGR